MALIYPEGYRYIDHIASHEFTQVVKALSPNGVEVALKIADNQGNVHRRFEREIHATLDAAGPSTIPVLDYDDSYSWYTMPLASHTLAKTKTPVAQASETLVILETIAESLRPLHANGQVHRDLKPENILSLPDENDGHWVVADFGIVRNAPGLTTAPLTVMGKLTGTQRWAAPEQYDDAHSSTPATDVYSAGLLMGWLITGILPTPGMQYSRLGSVTLSITRATHPDPYRRFQSLDDFYEHYSKRIAPIRATLDELFDDRQYDAIQDYLLEHPSRLSSIAKRMLRLEIESVDKWLEDDSFGLVATIRQICEGLSDNFNDVGRDNVDRFLSWISTVCQSCKNADMLDDLEALLFLQLSTTAQLDQWTPRRAALDWIDRQPRQIESIARRVIEETDTWDFYAEEARSRFTSRRRTELVQDLAD